VERFLAPQGEIWWRGQFSPTFEADDLMSLPNFAVYLRLMIGGEPSKAFSGETACPVGVTPSIGVDL